MASGPFLCLGRSNQYNNFYRWHKYMHWLWSMYIPMHVFLSICVYVLVKHTASHRVPIAHHVMHASGKRYSLFFSLLRFVIKLYIIFRSFTFALPLLCLIHPFSLPFHSILSSCLILSFISFSLPWWWGGVYKICVSEMLLFSLSMMQFISNPDF